MMPGSPGKTVGFTGESQIGSSPTTRSPGKRTITGSESEADTKSVSSPTKTAGVSGIDGILSGELSVAPYGRDSKSALTM